MSMKHVRPRFDDDNQQLARVLKRPSQDSDDGIDSVSFGALNAAQKQINSRSSDDSHDDEPHNAQPNYKRKPHQKRPEKKQRSKHAPSESSSKKPVSKVRKIEGLEPKATSLHQDIRFDAAYGRADLHETRKNYAFLDKYRESEIGELQKLMKDKKTFSKLSEREQQEIKLQMQSLKSRLDTLKSRDLEHKVLSDYKEEQMRNVREGKQAVPYFLKKSDERRLVQKAKFEAMRPAQRQKVMERKRKRKLGKEFRELEFRN